MPDLCRARRGAAHTVDTALRALAAAGVDDARISLESAGPGWPDGRVVRQHPPPGAALDARARVVLGVGGAGTLDALPYALRDDDDEAPFGVEALVALLDTPALKLRHHLRAGGDFFALRAGDLRGARRWIERVFQVDPAPWDPARWPALARLLPRLHRLAGRPAGVGAALGLCFGLPVAEVAARRGLAPAPVGRRLALGEANSRLGVDTLLGLGPVDVVRIEVAIGPVPLADYHAHADGPDGPRTRERAALYALVLPAPLAEAVVERWVLRDAAPTRLADPFAAPGAAAPALGLTTRLGAAALAAAAPPTAPHV